MAFAQNLFHFLPGSQLVLLMAAVIGLSAPSAFAASYSKIILSGGQEAPGGNGTFQSCPGCFVYLTLNNSEQVAFAGLLDNTSGGFDDDNGVFRLRGQDVVEIVREGDPAPVGEGVFGAFFGDVSLNPTGQVVFQSILNDTDPSTSRGIFRGDGQSLVQIARAGQIAPDGNGVFADRPGQNFIPAFGDPLINGTGQVAFSAHLANSVDGGADDGGLYRGDGQSLVQIAREGQLAPDGDGQYHFFSHYSINDAGQVAFDATLGGATLSTRGIFRGSDDGVTVIARAGQSTPDGLNTLAYFGQPVINNAGEVAFRAMIDEISPNREALYRGDGTTLTQIARYGKPVPDGNGNYQQFFTPALNDAGQTAFFASVSGASGGATNGIFLDDHGSIVQIARKGQLAPGGGVFDLRFDPMINERGQVTFYAYINGEFDGGIYFYDETRGLQLVAREGGSLFGSTITRLYFDADGSISLPLRDRFSGLNDKGQVVFGFALQDGRSGIAIWTIPEPRSIYCLAMCLVALAAFNWPRSLRQV